MSPDGTRLAYESVVGDDFELFLRDLTSGAVRQLTDNDDDDWSPSWSSDGTHIAFTSNRGKNVDIYVLDLETSDTVRLTVDNGDDVYPFWGIDDRIYFNSNRSEVWEIYSISPDGAGLVKITETPKE
jgi:TolB protein